MYRDIAKSLLTPCRYLGLDGPVSVSAGSRLGSWQSINSAYSAATLSRSVFTAQVANSIHATCLHTFSDVWYNQRDQESAAPLHMMLHQRTAIHPRAMDLVCSRRRCATRAAPGMQRTRTQCCLVLVPAAQYHSLNNSRLVPTTLQCRRCRSGRWAASSPASCSGQQVRAPTASASASQSHTSLFYPFLCFTTTCLLCILVPCQAR